MLKPRVSETVRAAPAPFLTSRGVEVVVPTSPGHDLGIREGDVVDAGEEDEDFLVKRLD